jgi:hypothetical protein
MRQWLRMPRTIDWRWIVPIVFVSVSGRYLAAYLAGPGSFGFDARLYAFAARALLEGRDPWHAEFYGMFYAGPPTTLIPFIPFAYVPEQIVAAFWIAMDIALVILVLRRLHMPAWWLAWPPLFYAIVLGSVEPLMVALLVLGGRLAGLSLLLKPYAVLPLVADRRWQEIAIAGGIGLVSIVLLPWATFLSELDWIRDRLTVQASVISVNAWANPILLVLGAMSLLSFGPRLALWLATPVLWPGAITHYAAMTLPVVPLVVAVLWALPYPGALVIGIIVGAFVEQLRTRPWVASPRMVGP